MKTNNHPILLFDGVCNLCSTAVQFIIKQDKKACFRFASLQSETGQKLLQKFKLPTDDITTMVLVEGDKYYTHSTAGLRNAWHMGGLWRIFYLFIIIPKPIRDGVYNWIARNRYRWFGQSESCMIPTAELKARFLD